MTSFKNRNGLLWQMTYDFGNEITLVVDYKERFIKLFFGKIERETYDYDMSIDSFGSLVASLHEKYSQE